MRALKRARTTEPFNPAMLLTARQARGMFQKDVAQAIGVSQSLVGKWEAKLASPSAEQVRGLAAALGVQPDFFFLHRPHHRASMAQYYHRALAKAGQYDVQATHARCCIAALQVERLLQAAGPCPDRLPTVKTSELAPDEVAAQVREAMGLGTGPVDNLVNLIEQHGGIIIDRGMEIDEMDALCWWVPGLPKLFFVNGSKSADRMRFSLAHELGHTVMHYGEDVEHKTAEDQANRFASAFLMPEGGFRRDVRRHVSLADLAGLKRKWRVSMQAIVRRMKDLGLITEKRYQSLYIQMSRQGWRRAEPVSIANETPRRFRHLIKWHLDAGFSREQMAMLLFVSPVDVDEIMADHTAAPEWEDEGVRLRLVR